MKRRTKLLSGSLFTGLLVASHAYRLNHVDWEGPVTTDSDPVLVVTIDEDYMGYVEVAPPQQLNIRMLPIDSPPALDRCNDMGGTLTPNESICQNVDY